MNPTDPAIVLIAGPTGVGKSALAVELAERVGGEIISADSRQLYRRLEIGTAQPTAEERARVPHHLVSFLPPDRPFSAAEFVTAAEAVLADLAARRQPAFLVGGTNHYVQALLDRLQLPRVAPRWKHRQQLEQDLSTSGPEQLHARLAALDPPAAATIPPANVRRVIRALEVIEATGQRFSDLSRGRGQPRPALRLGLTMPRAELYARIDARVDSMVRVGWLDEIRRLLEAGYDPRLPALTSTGYRELIQHLSGDLTLDQAVQLVKYSTHAYVRRQYAWLRRDAQLIWLDPGADLLQRALALTRDHLNTTPSPPHEPDQPAGA